jgi:hypothetical protein
MATKKSVSRYTSVRLTPADLDNITKLSALVARSGWAAVGSTRTTAVTFGGLVSEAAAQMLARAAAKKT